MFAGPGRARPHYERLLQRFTELTEGEFDRKRDLAELTLLRQGVTFTVYNDAKGTERIFPFDLIPRIISAEEWKKIERGLEQRITALNLFLHDIYHGQSILRDGMIPKDYVWQAAHFRPEFMHFNVPRNIYIHICGSDLVRDRDGNFLVLEDNARCPSGVSYVVQNRQVMRRVFPNLFAQHRVRPVEDYSQELLNVLRYIAPAGKANPTIVLLTPGIYNFVPKMIRYYLDQDAILPNVDTYLAADDTDRAFILENLEKLVVKAANESGGYGMLVGSNSTKAEREKFRERIRKEPRNYIAQPIIPLSRSPAFDDGIIRGRHVDL